ncbi:MAG TPA: hypothetical protein VMQ81_06745, partial [Acidimicrobiia bacterium]|nr:hypothetical protein [Acidimicrobiia bacterium]
MQNASSVAGSASSARAVSSARAGRADRRPGSLGDEMGGAAMPVLAPHLGLVDPAGAARLDGGADPFSARGQLDERRRIPPVKAGGVEGARCRLELGERTSDPREHGSL